jgi:hypothetical protein
MVTPTLQSFWLDVGLIFRRLTGTIDLTVYGDDNNVLGTSNQAIGYRAKRGLGLAALGTVTLGLDGQGAVENALGVDTPERVGLNVNSCTLKVKISNNRLNESFVFLGIIYAVYPASHFLFDSSRKIYI